MIKKTIFLSTLVLTIFAKTPDREIEIQKLYELTVVNDSKIHSYIEKALTESVDFDKSSRSKDELVYEIQNEIKGKNLKEEFSNFVDLELSQKELNQILDFFKSDAAQKLFSFHDKNLLFFFKDLYSLIDTKIKAYIEEETTIRLQNENEVITLEKQLSTQDEFHDDIILEEFTEDESILPPPVEYVLIDPIAVDIKNIKIEDLDNERFQSEIIQAPGLFVIEVIDGKKSITKDQQEALKNLSVRYNQLVKFAKVDIKKEKLNKTLKTGHQPKVLVIKNGIVIKEFVKSFTQSDLDRYITQELHH